MQYPQSAAATEGTPLVARFSEKTLYEAYLLWLPPFGLLGGHHYYLRRYLMGIMYTCTLGFIGVGLLVDLFRMPSLVRDANAARRHEPPKTELRSTVDAYLFWLPPFGLLGAHHFYLGRHVWGMAYFFTLGLFGLGYLFDLVYIPFMVRDINDKVNNGAQCSADTEKSLASAYFLALPPLGLFGSHQLYLKNHFMFAMYTCTLGLLGLGWLVDLLRMPVLMRRCRERVQGHAPYDKLYMDDAYLLLLPFGLLGMHHFYLRRYVFGFIYLLTLGLGGVGVLADLFLIPTYVKRGNAEAEERLRECERRAAQLHQQQRLLPATYCTVVVPQQPLPCASAGGHSFAPLQAKAEQATMPEYLTQVRGSSGLALLMPTACAAPVPSYYGVFQPTAPHPAAFATIQPPPYSYDNPAAAAAGLGSGRVQQ